MKGLTKLSGLFHNTYMKIPEVIRQQHKTSTLKVSISQVTRIVLPSSFVCQNQSYDF